MYFVCVSVNFTSGGGLNFEIEFYTGTSSHSYWYTFKPTHMLSLSLSACVNIGCTNFEIYHACQMSVFTHIMQMQLFFVVLFLTYSSFLKYNAAIYFLM
jgi:hypothetical protein